ncbi:MAG: glycosyltransferase family 4 protein [Myxococcales bacterium]|nr:glycosyltransferase family 4 protein [Myxococcales bacterium]
MRVAYLTSQYPAPSHTFILREVEALREQGVDVQTFSVRRPAAAEVMSQADRQASDSTWYALPPAPLTLLGSQLWALSTRPAGALKTLVRALRHRPPGLRSLVYAGFYWAEAIMLARELDRQEIAHVHNHFANPAAIVGYLATSMLDLPWSLTLHGISEFDYPAGLLLPDKIGAAKFIACVSHFGRAQAFRMTDPHQWDKLIIVRCGLDMRDLPDRVPETSRARPRVVCVGRLSPEKGHIGLLRAFSQQRRAGLDAELCLIGDGPEQARIEAEIDRLGLQDDCVMLGRQPNDRVLREVANSDVLVMASFMEGLPVVLMEALALEVPVIAPCVAGIPELVDDTCGLLFAPGDWDQLANALGQMLQDPQRRLRMGKEGRQRIEAEFDVRRAVEPLLSRFARDPT